MSAYPTQESSYTAVGVRSGNGRWLPTHRRVSFMAVLWLLGASACADVDFEQTEPLAVSQQKLVGEKESGYLATGSVLVEGEDQPPADERSNLLDDRSEPDVSLSEAFYNDGICNLSPDRPDPDCQDDGGWEPDASDRDICEEQGWYGDGVCDEGCARPDPDCESSGDGVAQDLWVDDVCEAQGWYGDGMCDEGCARPDPDCSFLRGDSSI